MYSYALRFDPCPGAGVAVLCRDLPELTSYGDTLEHALSESVDAVETTLSIYVDRGRVIPRASPAQSGEKVIYLPAATLAKIALWNALQEQELRQADACRLLDLSPAQAARLVDFLRPSKISTLEHALEKLGQRLVVYAQPA